MINNLGILLGRASKKANQKIQTFPKNLKHDLNLVKKIGLKNIEWLVDKPDLKNPIFDLNNNKNLFIKKNNLKIRSVLLHFLMIDNYYKIEVKSNFDVLNKMLTILCNIDLDNIIFPVKKFDNYFVNFFLEYQKKNLNVSKNIKFLIESNEPPSIIINKIKKYKLKNLFLLYDIGNYSDLDRNISNDIIRYHKMIKEFHLKDKLNGKNVPYGIGKVDFNIFFEIYSKLNLNTIMIMENYVDNNSYIDTKKQLEFILNR